MTTTNPPVNPPANPPTDPSVDPAERETRRRRTLGWVIGLGFLGLVFDGYDLVVYGAVLPGLLADPGQIGEVTPAAAGPLGSYALIGVLVGALLTGTVSDLIGRRKLMLVAYAWFAVAMGLTSFATSTTQFGLGRFVAGVGIGALLATTGALVAEYAPAGRKNLYNALTYSGIAFGSTMSALLAILLLEHIGWRGMFLVGALPLVTLLPLAVVKLPESPAWLQSRGRHEEAAALAARTGADLAEPAQLLPSGPVPVGAGRPGFAGLFTGGNAAPALLIGSSSVCCLLLVYGLNTWLPELMGRAGFSTKGSLSFLLVFNGSAVVGQLIGSRMADRFGPKAVITAFFLVGTAAIALLTLDAPLGVLLLFAAVAGTAQARFGRSPAVLTAVVGYAVVSEVVQGLLLARRSGDPLDVVADLLGVALGWWAAGSWLDR